MRTFRPRQNCVWWTETNYLFCWVLACCDDSVSQSVDIALICSSMPLNSITAEWSFSFCSVVLRDDCCSIKTENLHVQSAVPECRQIMGLARGLQSPGNSRLQLVWKLIEMYWLNSRCPLTDSSCFWQVCYWKWKWCLGFTPETSISLFLYFYNYDHGFSANVAFFAATGLRIFRFMGMTNLHT